MLAELKLWWCVFVFLFCCSVTTKDPPEKFIRVPDDSSITILRLKDYDYKVAWWEWGPSRIEEQSSVFPSVPPIVLKQLMIANICGR